MDDVLSQRVALDQRDEEVCVPEEQGEQGHRDLTNQKPSLIGIDQSEHSTWSVVRLGIDCCSLIFDIGNKATLVISSEM